MNTLQKYGHVLACRFPSLGVSQAVAKLVIICLQEHYNHEKGYSYPSYQLIADETGCSRNTAINAINALVDVGILRLVNRIDNKPLRRNRGDGCNAKRSKRQTSNAYWIDWRALLEYVPAPEKLQGVPEFIYDASDEDDEGPVLAASTPPESPSEGSKSCTPPAAEVRPDVREGSKSCTHAGTDSVPTRVQQLGTNLPTGTSQQEQAADDPPITPPERVDPEWVVAAASVVDELEVWGVSRDSAKAALRHHVFADRTDGVTHGVFALVAIGVDPETANTKPTFYSDEEIQTAVMNACQVERSGKIVSTTAAYAIRNLEARWSLKKRAREYAEAMRQTQARSRSVRSWRRLRAFAESDRLQAASHVAQTQPMHHGKGDPLTTFHTQGDWDHAYMAACLDVLDRQRALDELEGVEATTQQDEHEEAA